MNASETVTFFIGAAVGFFLGALISAGIQKDYICIEAKAKGYKLEQCGEHP